MYIGKTLFAQIMDFIPWTSFGRIVARYRGNARVRSLPCTEQFRVMAFAQMTCGQFPQFGPRRFPGLRTT